MESTIFTVKGTSDLLGTVPALFGFHPENSLIAIATYGPRNRYTSPRRSWATSRWPPRRPTSPSMTRTVLTTTTRFWRAAAPPGRQRSTANPLTVSGMNSSATSLRARSSSVPAGAPTAPAASPSTPASAAPCCVQIPPSKHGWKRSSPTSASAHQAHERGWLGEVDGLNTSLTAAEQKLAQMRRTATNLGLPAFPPRMPEQT